MVDPESLFIFQPNLETAPFPSMFPSSIRPVPSFSFRFSGNPTRTITSSRKSPFVGKLDGSMGRVRYIYRSMNGWLFNALMLIAPFCKWLWSGFWVPKHLLTGHTLEVQPPFFIGWFPNHHYFSRGLSSSKRNYHFLNGSWLPGYINIPVQCILWSRSKSIYESTGSRSKSIELKRVPFINMNRFIYLLWTTVLATSKNKH